MDARTRGQRYLDHLTRADRELLRRGASLADEVDLARRPERIEGLLDDPQVSAVMFPETGEEHERLVGASPFLLFAVAIHRSRTELADLPYVAEWTGPRQRLPVFATEQLRNFLDEAEHRLFLAELLASYTHVAGGAISVRRRGVIHRRRFSELDLTDLARLLDLADEQVRPGLYRRLGDLALFLTGVFPDHTARHRFAPIQLDRLARALDTPGFGRDELVESLAARGTVGLLEQLGKRWYRLALETAGADTDSLRVVGSVGDRFVDARRVLNHLTDRYLFPHRDRWFPSSN